MSRFVNLELGNQFEGPTPKPSVSKDEKFFLSEARAAFQAGHFDKSLRAYSKVLEFSTDNEEAWVGQVRMLIELQEFQEARVWADKALQRYPDSPELLAAKAVALARLGDLKAALTYSDASIEERGNSAYVWLARGDVLLARKENRADYCFEKAVSYAPTDWIIRWLAARIYHYYKKFTSALKLVHEALGLSASQAVVWLLQGHCQAELGLVAQAATSYRQARELCPDGREADDGLRSLARRGWWDTVRKRFLNWTE